MSTCGCTTGHVCEGHKHLMPRKDSTAGAGPEVTLASLWGAAPNLRCEKCAPTLPPVGERETDAMPAGWSETRRKVQELLTARIVSIGNDLGEACESQTLNLGDAKAVRAFAHILTMRDPDGHDGEFGEEQRVFWNAMRDALATRPSPAPSGERVGGADIGLLYAAAIELPESKSTMRRELCELASRLAAAPHSDGAA